MAAIFPVAAETSRSIELIDRSTNADPQRNALLMTTTETESTRDRILREALRLFWEKGYGSTSIQDILRAAGANSGSLYHFFPAKQDLLLAVLDAYLAGLHPEFLAPIWSGIDDPIDRVFALLAKYRELLVETDCFYGCPVGSLALELHEPDPAIREKLAANFAGWTEAVRGCLVAAGDRIPESVDRGELAQFVLTTMEGGVMQARTHRSIAAFDASVHQLRTYFDLLRRGALPLAAGLVMAASPTRAAEVPEHFRPFAFLAEGCWKGTMPDGKAVDTHCWEWMYEGAHLRDRHVVTGPKAPYRGETVYSWDAERKRVIYRYWNSLGGFSDGDFEVVGDTLVSSSERYVGPEGPQEFRTILTRLDENRYESRTEKRSGDSWRLAWRVEFSRAPAE